MLVRDWDKSEVGKQRKRDAIKRLIHCCCICGKLDIWGRNWTTYCSERDLDDEAPIPKFCSERCKQQGGPDAQNVTQAMKQKAKDAEWRDPEPAWREATEIEKYRHAVQEQSGRR